MTAMQQIEQLCIEARAHGMTYGEYVGTLLKPAPKLQKRKKEPEKKERLAACVICGKKFIQQHGLQKYCKDCKREKWNAYQRERKKNRRKKEIR